MQGVGGGRSEGSGKGPARLVLYGTGLALSEPDGKVSFHFLIFKISITVDIQCYVSFRCMT